MSKNLSMLFGCAMLTGCAGANVISASWNTPVAAAEALTRCEQLDMRDQAQMDAVFSKYDGWKMIYISEYTTGNRIGTDGSVCFERPK